MKAHLWLRAIPLLAIGSGWLLSLAPNAAASYPAGQSFGLPLSMGTVGAGPLGNGLLMQNIAQIVNAPSALLKFQIPISAAVPAGAQLWDGQTGLPPGFLPSAEFLSQFDPSLIKPLEIPAIFNSPFASFKKTELAPIVAPAVLEGGPISGGFAASAASHAL